VEQASHAREKFITFRIFASSSTNSFAKFLFTIVRSPQDLQASPATTQSVELTHAFHSFGILSTGSSDAYVAADKRMSKSSMEKSYPNFPYSQTYGLN
jgi:hypothetical protein